MACPGGLEPPPPLLESDTLPLRYGHVERCVDQAIVYLRMTIKTYQDAFIYLLLHPVSGGVDGGNGKLLV
jgi:hypothetical protein